MNKFENVNISEDILRGISDMGFEEMSPIQKEAIPVLLEGKDIIGQAQTGTGKTAAFGIPILERIDVNNKNVQAIVLCPTRELSIQVSEEISKLGKHKKGLKVLPIYGGQPINRQIKSLKKGVQVVVGTPGRLIDHIKRNTLRLDDVDVIVLDEADEMFDMGFRDDMAFVIGKLQGDRQTVFFSATMAKNIVNFAKRYQKKPEMIKVVQKELTVPRVEQSYYEVKPHMKTEVLTRLIDLNNPELSVVFCNTKRQVDKLVEELLSKGYFVDGLHGDLKQGQRDRVMNKFRKGNIDILVATDVAARGIDVDEVDAVFNYDMPQDVEYYVHRIGRTARAGREGKAFNFVSRRDFSRLKDIQRYTKTKIERRDIPSARDLEDNKLMELGFKIKKELEKNNLSKYRKMVEELLVDEYNSFDLAAVLLKLSLEEENSVEVVDMPIPIAGEVARIYISTGKKMGVSAAHILAGMIEYTGIDKSAVGKIDIFDSFSFAEVPEMAVDNIINKLDGKNIGGRRVRVERAKPRRN